MVLHTDLVSLVKLTGYFGLACIVFAESGLFFGFFLPGDSLLFTAGFLASQGYLNIALVVLICFAAAVIGDSFGYAFGLYLGPKIFNKTDSIFFHKKHLVRAEEFYKKYGKKTLILARFVPVVRTFAPILAGVGQMSYGTFFAYNVIGGAIWGIGLPLVGYFLGSMVPNIDRYLLPIILGIIFVSFLPIVFEYIKAKKSRI